jgi:hypothetical protein
MDLKLETQLNHKIQVQQHIYLPHLQRHPLNIAEEDNDTTQRNTIYPRHPIYQ